MNGKGRLNLKILIMIGLIVAFLLLAPKLGIRPLTILSVSKVEIEPEGYVDEDNKVRGSFWITTMLTDCTDKAASWKFHNETDRDRYYKGEQVDLASEIEIIIDPEQPYWERPLEVHSHQVYPKTYGTWRDVRYVPYVTIGKREDTWIPSLSVNTYQFGSRAGVPNVWTVHTPFWVTLRKNGIELAKEYVDTVGMVETIKMANPDDPQNEYILIKNLGKLGTGYGQPSITDIICIEQQLDYIFSGSDEVENKINYDVSDLSYSNYWFGGGQHYKTSGGHVVKRWGDGSPAHYYYVGFKKFVVADDGFPGSEREDEFMVKEKVRPIEADIWHDNSYTKPYGKSLVNYLKQYHNTLDVDVWKCGAEITDDNFLRINMPFASVNSLITLQISTEIADTIVWKPQIANVKFVSCEWQTAGTDADIQDRLSAVLTVKQHSSVKSTATIKPVFEKTGQPIAINPLAHTVDLAPDETKTVKFEFLNLGTEKDLENKVTFIIENTLGVETDRSSLTFTLKKKGVAETILTVHTIDAETEMGIGGIPITITYDSSTQTAYTIDGTVVFDLEGVEGTTSVKSSETTTYQSASAITTVKAGEPNKVTLRLYKKGVTPPQPLPFWLFLLLIMIPTSIALYAMTRRKKR